MTNSWVGRIFSDTPLAPLKRGTRSSNNYICIDEFIKFNPKYLMLAGCTSPLKRGIRNANNYKCKEEFMKFYPKYLILAG
jgi:hypothetical protein